MDFSIAAKLSGARFVVLKGQLARLERALAFSCLMCIHMSMVILKLCAGSCAQTDNDRSWAVPKFSEDLFHTTDDRWLIPTAEVPLTNLVADSIVPSDHLPLRFTAFTPCFRAEAGSAGRDTRGLIRQHQFSKVELVSIVAPDQSEAELERMTACAETILQKLGLSYRLCACVLEIRVFQHNRHLILRCGFPVRMRKGKYREISSCSNCGPFQARRMKAEPEGWSERYRICSHVKRISSCSWPRMIAILENGQQADGTIALPEVLHSYMGTDILVPAKG